MDEYTEDSFANREEAIPVLSFDAEDDLSDEVEAGARKGGLFSTRRSKTAKNGKENIKPQGVSLQDRMLEK